MVGGGDVARRLSGRFLANALAAVAFDASADTVGGSVEDEVMKLVFGWGCCRDLRYGGEKMMEALEVCR